MSRRLWRIYHTRYDEKLGGRIGSPFDYIASEQTQAQVERMYRLLHGLKDDEEVHLCTTTLEDERNMVLRELQPCIPLGLAFHALRGYIDAIHQVTYFMNPEGSDSLDEVKAAELIREIATTIHQRALSWELLPEEQRMLPTERS